jgi:hypothetical protein
MLVHKLLKFEHSVCSVTLRQGLKANARSLNPCFIFTWLN